MKDFIAAVKTNPSLQKELSEAVLAVAKKNGFEPPASEAKNYASSQSVSCVDTLWTAVCSA